MTGIVRHIYIIKLGSCKGDCIKKCFIGLRFILSLNILILFSLAAKTQQFTFTRTHLFEENVRGFITGIAQDSKGYMWFTGTSLYRYDGYHVVTYKNDPLNPQSIAPARLEYIYIDRKDMIWLGTVGAGLDKFDPSTGLFTHYQNNPADPSSLSNNTVTLILEDAEGTLWVGTHGGLNRLDKKTGKFTRFKHDPNDSTSLSNDQVRALYQDKKGIIWVGCGSPYNNETPDGEGGLNRMDPGTGKFTCYRHQENNPHTLFDNKVRAIFEDSRGNFWVGTFGDGLHIMDRDKGTFTRYPYDPLHPEKLSSPNMKGNFEGVSFITEDKAGGIWIGSFLAGLNYYDPKTSKLTRYKAESGNINALGENTVWNVATSRDGVIWITTQSNVYRVNPLQKGILHTETGGRVHAFHEDDSAVLWLASDSGLIKKDKKNNTVQYFVNNPTDPASISSDLVLYVYRDSKNRLWAGTDKGLDLLNNQTNKFTRFLHDDKNTNSISNGAVTSMFEDRHGAFWIATDGGLDLMDPQTGLFRHFRHSAADTNSLSSNAVYKIIEDKSGNLWIGTWSAGGINVMDTKTGRFKHYLQGNNVVDIYQDSDSVIWVGTQFGLYRKNDDNDDFSAFIDPTSELGTANIASITEDTKRNLWIGSQSAIIKLNYKRNETAIFGRKYGVIPNSIYDLTAYRASNGELLFGDGTGYYEFFPGNLTIDAIAPQLQFTDFKIADVSLKPGQAPLDGPVEEMKEIKLNYKQNNFSIDFAGIHYSSIDENRHYFMLEGYDKKWRKSGLEKTAGYFNVPPGKYIFKIKASSSDGIWAQKAITITITPPWWLTWWAYALYIIVLAALIWSIIYYRSRSLLKEKKLLEQQVKIRTAEVVQQNEKIAIQRDNLAGTLLELKSIQDQLVQHEKMASLGELTAGIAHEIKNPLNFVNNFAEVTAELLKEMNDQLDRGHLPDAKIIALDAKENLEKIAHHGKLADAIVQGMLQHSGKSTGKKELTDINAFTDEYLRLCYNKLKAKDKTFHTALHTDFDAGIEKVNIVPEEVGKVLLNIIGNSFYAVSEKKNQSADEYEPMVSVTTKKIHSFLEPSGLIPYSEYRSANTGVEIRIKDNGTGIPARLLGRVFHPFFTTKPTGQGTGLGLSLSYDIITKGHGGRIKVESKEGEFAEFIIQLPVIQYSEDKMSAVKTGEEE